jgi:hypothetical protein
LLFQRAAEGKRGEEALLAIGDAHIDEMLTDPIRPGTDARIRRKQRSRDPRGRSHRYGDLVA